MQPFKTLKCDFWIQACRQARSQSNPQRQKKPGLPGSFWHKLGAAHAKWTQRCTAYLNCDIHHLMLLGKSVPVIADSIEASTNMTSAKNKYDNAVLGHQATLQDSKRVSVHSSNVALLPLKSCTSCSFPSAKPFAFRRLPNQIELVRARSCSA